MNKQGGGTLIGGVAGALIGSQFGKGAGSLVGTGIGALAGAFIGGQIGKQMDDYDKQLLQQSSHRALENAPSGQSIEWRNPDSGHYGYVTPVNTFKNNYGEYCREYTQVVVIGGNRQKAYGKACRQPDGQWKKGEVTTLIGPNGAGKTTIAKLILRLDKPSSGIISINAPLKIGYVPQKLDFASNLPITAEKFLHLLTTNNLSQNSTELFDFIKLDSYRTQDISELSGGQLQKLVLAATLLNNPDLVILDEPTQSLDAVSQQEFYKIINQLKKSLNITIFMISHDLFTVIKNSDQVICLNKHICCSGKPNDLTENQDFLDTLSAIGFYTHHHDHKH
ncbi:Zinc import ATP-binding protein ZnuC [Pseudolycoriella hygida]|uniref:Zinc import ATP-binding protein ZnuC n=1 Tax=Pseudolycoriella hygida TaxID=35572 RepID=A0A9Q0S650_9DIPT|nr:Zinc import ATP-binding protein ZnuC [Pseudolycoriella hygida]